MPYPLLVAQDGQEHQPAAEPCAGPLADHDHQRNPVGCGQRPVTLVNLDRLEASAVRQPAGNGIQHPAVNDIAQYDAGELHHLVVRYGVVAMHPNLDNRFRRRRGGGRAKRQHRAEYTGTRPRRNAARPQRHHRSSGTARKPPPVTASR